jgi:hypothetical protein
MTGLVADKTYLQGLGINKEEFRKENEKEIKLKMLKEYPNLKEGDEAGEHLKVFEKELKIKL